MRAIATATGAPTTGTHIVGEFYAAQDGCVWMCVVAGTPGTWTRTNSAQSRLSKHSLCR